VKQAYEAQTNRTATEVVMLNGSTTTELWLDWVPRAWPCVQSTGDPWRQLDYLAYTRYCLLAFCLAVVTTVMTVATIAAYREWKPYILAVFFIVRVRASGRSTRELPAEVHAKELEEVPAKTLVEVPAKTLEEVPAKTLVEVPAKTLVEVPAKTLVPRGAGTTLGSTPTPMEEVPATTLGSTPTPMEEVPATTLESTPTPMEEVPATTLGSTPTPMGAGQPASSSATLPRPMPDDWEEL
jgi:hypothetical protein